MKEKKNSQHFRGKNPTFAVGRTHGVYCINEERETAASAAQIPRVSASVEPTTTTTTEGVSCSVPR